MSLPDVVPNTMSAEPSFAPPMDVRPARKAPNPAHTTSELPPPVEVPLSGKAISEPQTAEAPLPHRVRDTDFTAFCSSLCSMVPSSHPGEQQIGTAPQRHQGSETTQ